MKKFLITFSVVAAVIAILSFDHQAYAQSSDLCGGTNGNGEIISVGSNTFTLQLNDGNNVLVNLADRATIETSSGYATISDLNIGDRVTLVGDNHRDGTFTADAVVLCNTTQGIGTQENGTDQSAPVTVRNSNSEAYEKVSSMLHAGTYLLVGFVWLSAVAFFLLKKKKSFVYILFFTIFYIYLYKVLDYTVLQFQSLLLLQHFLPDLMLRGIETGRSINLIPLTTLTLEDMKTSLLNILMMMPFGFGLPFITNLRFKKVVTAGLLFSVGIELLQFVTGFVANTTFRVADINDVLFNTIGGAIGYLAFIVFVRLYRRVFPGWKTMTNSILQYIGTRPQVD